MPKNLSSISSNDSHQANDADYIEAFEDNWDIVADEVRQSTLHQKGFAYIVLQWNDGGLKLDYMVVIGKRGGLTEHAIIIDSSKKIVTDRLIVDKEFADHDGELLPLDEARSTCGKNQANLVIFCEKKMAEIAERIKVNREKYTLRIQHALELQQSVFLTAGGLRGSGRKN